MPQTRTKATRETVGKIDSLTPIVDTSAMTSARELIQTMVRYETAAQKNGGHFASSRYRMLTASEREYLSAELVADYIRLCAGNLGKTPGYYDAALASFCSKICELEVPSHELLGTYLAATDLVSTEEELKAVPMLDDAVRRTIIDVLQTCIDKIWQKAEQAAAAPRGRLNAQT